jgi:hypothetical protein
MYLSGSPMGLSESVRAERAHAERLMGGPINWEFAANRNARRRATQERLDRFLDR